MGDCLLKYKEGVLIHIIESLDIQQKWYSKYRADKLKYAGRVSET